MANHRSKKFNKALGQKIKAARSQAKMSLDDVSKKTRLGKGSLSRIENGGNPTIGSLSVIAEAVGSDVCSLLPEQ